MINDKEAIKKIEEIQDWMLSDGSDRDREDEKNKDVVFGKLCDVWTFLNATSEFKPCPFCGGVAERYDVSIRRFVIRCSRCWACTRVFGEDHYLEAREAWNRRIGNG